ncbi:MAG: DNA replication and repair protein RecF [Bacteroidetes bacterium]|nr:DNA replication and repair protein RecF [Bacteroidota bacterium]
MFQLKKISLVQFKNYEKAFFPFEERIVCIHGNNGIGKTNLLDAIYYLCFTKSYFSKSDQQHVRHGHAGFRLEGTFELNGDKKKVLCILRETGKKEISINDDMYEKFSLHIGKLPCVIITPDDAQIITEGSEERRRFMDALLSQIDPAYLQQLIEYNKIIQQRNSFLKSIAEKKTTEKSLLDIYDEQLMRPGIYIFEKRKSFFEEILPLIKTYYKKIAGSEEQIDLVYESHLLHESFKDLLHRSRDKDILLQRSNVGIHKDDIEVKLKNQPFKNIASQGQRKSLLFALKLAEYETLKKAKGFEPILLLDDVFEKLDAERMHNLLDWVCVQNKGQIFITDTHEERISNHLLQLGINYQMIALG